MGKQNIWLFSKEIICTPMSCFLWISWWTVFLLAFKQKMSANLLITTNIFVNPALRFILKRWKMTPTLFFFKNRFWYALDALVVFVSFSPLSPQPKHGLCDFISCYLGLVLGLIDLLTVDGFEYCNGEYICSSAAWAKDICVESWSARWQSLSLVIE